MDAQRWICVIDWFGKNYDGTMPSIVFTCDETWFGLFRSRRQIPRYRVWRPPRRTVLSQSLIE
jgi:hypothetical protein